MDHQYHAAVEPGLPEESAAVDFDALPTITMFGLLQAQLGGI
jgi:hypothetical protein